MKLVNAIRVDQDGYVEEFRQFEEQAPENWIDIGDQPLVFNSYRKKYVDGVVIDAESIIKVTYQTRRQNEYPAIGDQLDALWKELGPGAKTPEAKAMYQAVQEVKNKYPKEPNNK